MTKEEIVKTYFGRISEFNKKYKDKPTEILVN